MKPLYLFFGIIALIIGYGLGLSVGVGVGYAYQFQIPDTIFIKMPGRYDTVDVSGRFPSMTCIVLDKKDLKGYVAPGTVAFYFKWHPTFINVKRKKQAIKFLSYSTLSDSLQASNRAFFKRHIFFVVIDRNDTSYFYRAAGNYMYKNFKNDVREDTARGHK